MGDNLIIIIIQCFSTCIPAVVTIITSRGLKIIAKKHASRQSILQLILEDKFRVEVEHKNPENFKAIMDEYDEYKKCYGNHYITDKVDEYHKWYKEINKKA